MLNKIINKCKLVVVRNQFSKSAQLGDNVTLTPTARCINDGAKENINIGNHCCISAVLISRFGGKITIGDNTFINSGTNFYCKESIEIGSEVIIANNVYIMDNNSHPISPIEREKMSYADNYLTDELWSWKSAESAKVTVGNNVWIARDVRIMKGVTIGKGSIVALGSIVTHDVPEYCIVAGNPARVVKKLNSSEKQ